MAPDLYGASTARLRRVELGVLSALNVANRDTQCRVDDFLRFAFRFCLVFFAFRRANKFFHDLETVRHCLV
jgi:hypothetical protein